MESQHVLLDATAGVALLLWATRLVGTGFMRAYGERLRSMVGKATANRVSACLIGAGVATVLQSSTGSSLLAMSFLERGFIALPTALAILLGTNIGTTLVVQALSFDLGAVMPLLVIAGVSAFLLGRTATTRNVGRSLIGLGLMILSLRLVVEVAEPLRNDRALIAILQQLAGQPVLAVVIAALIAWAAHSSVAVVLLIMSLAASGVIEPR